MKKIGTLVLALVCLFETACSPIEMKARDTAAALSGAIVAAQSKYLGSCLADPKQAVCVAINHGVNAENALVTSVETYCGWQVNLAPPDPKATCVPVKSASAALTAAIANAAQATLEIKGAL